MFQRIPRSLALCFRVDRIVLCHLLYCVCVVLYFLCCTGLYKGEPRTSVLRPVKPWPAGGAVVWWVWSVGAGLRKVFTCLACGKVLCSKASLKRHVADKHASRHEEYRCAICERVYCSRNSLMTHIYTYHKPKPSDHLHHPTFTDIMYNPDIKPQVL